MAETRPRVPRRAAIRIGRFAFDRTRPAESACAAYILAAPEGSRSARMRRLILLGHVALQSRRDRHPPDDNER